tara:strand:- start:159 stop:338 length:180 start_codon:yes stop_codon:yes gene_type:complete
MLTQLFKGATMDIELPNKADRMIKSSRARNRRRLVKDIREMRQHNFYAKIQRLKKKRKK